jgi:hypothetical protein
MSFYDFALTNVQNYLRRIPEADRLSGEALNAFQITEVLAIVFCKRKEDILADLLRQE